MTEPDWSVGLMTGTVLDGEIDVALLRTNGEEILEFGSVATCHYSNGVRDEIRLAMDDASAWSFSGDRPASFVKAERSLTEDQAKAVNNTLTETGLNASQVSVIGFHGQTVLHRPPTNLQSCLPGQFSRGDTVQLGDGALLSKLTGVTVVHDFRRADMRHGGQGAPLVPVYHQALLQQVERTENLPALVNLGGIANITWWDGQYNLIAFDTGPANAPLNDWIDSHEAGDFDRDGLIAGRGSVDEQKLQVVFGHSFFSAAFPKSLDRQDFSALLADTLQGMSLEDGAAFLVAVCAGSIAQALTLLPEKPGQLVLCGGGRHNKTLFAEIRDRTGCDVVVAEKFGWRGDAMEAECFAFLAERVLRHMPTSFPSTTGCDIPVCGGTVSRCF